jgi:hypothetical protein
VLRLIIDEAALSGAGWEVALLVAAKMRYDLAVGGRTPGSTAAPW